MTPSADLRSEAESLARQLPGLNFKAEASEAAHIGSAGRRRAGTGEHFWQYRRYAQEDAADRVDWRRSAKGTDTRWIAKLRKEVSALRRDSRKETRIASPKASAARRLASRAMSVER